MSIRVLKLIAVALIFGGVVATTIFSGVGTTPLTCSPFLLFGAAAALGRYHVSAICTIIALLLSVGYGIHSYHEAFWIHQHGEADAIALIVVPLVQALVGLLTFIVAFIEWLLYRSRHREIRAA